MMVCGKRYCAALRTVRRCPNFIAAKVAYVEGNSCPAWLCLSLRTEIRSANLSLADSPVPVRATRPTRSWTVGHLLLDTLVRDFQPGVAPTLTSRVALEHRSDRGREATWQHQWFSGTPSRSSTSRPEKTVCDQARGQLKSLILIPHHLLSQKTMIPRIHRVGSTVPDPANRRRSQRHEAGRALQDMPAPFRPSPTVSIRNHQCAPATPIFGGTRGSDSVDPRVTTTA